MYDKVYFIGIGGIGISGIARYYNQKGYKVSGYDKVESILTRELQSEGIEVHYEDNIDFVPKDVEGTLVIYTPAVPADMGELVYVKTHGYRVIKRSKALGEIAEGQQCLAVAGSHGKTTTSTLVAHILTDCGVGCSGFLGGISKNYNTNLLVSDNPVLVAEADEFDHSFLQLFPSIAVITSMDPDHLDIYGDAEHYYQAFQEFASQVSDTVITKIGLDITSEHTKAKILRYSLDDSRADFYAKNITIDQCGYSHFDLVYPGGVIEGCTAGIPGKVNIENSIGAAAAALTYGIAPEAVAKAVANYKGVVRRFDIHYNIPGHTYIDDFGHHPEEVATSIRTLREIFPGRRLTIVFRPHLFTRTRDFYKEFAKVLSTVDELVLLEIYPAREEPIEGVTSKLIYDLVDGPKKRMIMEADTVKELEGEDIDVVATVGCGNFDKTIAALTQMMERKYGKN
ncbi:MAG: UDP-N-acetylmuramate--L-alanine ligase [Bacteroidales bacterium]|nr:UDP-N-acetylmuramate--L-alanine ligase [Bacteroidales bacterium]